MEHRLRQPSAAKVVDEAQDQLRSKGLRVTPQRLVILKILEESGEHLDAEAIHTRARAHAPSVSLATVYRTLRTLKDAGLVTQRRSEACHTRTTYETTSKEAHHHFLCVGCGKVVEIPVPLLDDAFHELARQLGVTLTGANLEGYCEGCIVDMTILRDAVELIRQEEGIRRGHALANPNRPVEPRRR